MNFVWIWKNKNCGKDKNVFWHLAPNITGREDHPRPYPPKFEGLTAGLAAWGTGGLLQTLKAPLDERIGEPSQLCITIKGRYDSFKQQYKTICILQSHK